MEECQREGLTRNIGLSNFNSKQVQRILNSCSIKPSNHQIEITPYFNNSRLRDFCMENGITVTAFAPLGAPYEKLQDDTNVLKDPVLQELAEAKGKTVAQIILRYHLQNGLIVVPKSVTPSRIKENIQVYDFELTDEEMGLVFSFERGLRKFWLGTTYKDDPEYPFHEAF